MSRVRHGAVSAIAAERPKAGLRQAWVGLAAVILLQTALGRFSAAGANLLWLHVPLGVALVGFAAQAANAARRLGTDGPTS